MSVDPPRPSGPPLNALRAFEAAARWRSFTAAAEELHVTPGAVAQHIKSLERWADSPLFVRHARGVGLTPLGEELLPGFTAAFDRLGEAVQRLRTCAAPKKIRIATLPAIAQLWLPNRLKVLRDQAPDLSVSVYALESRPNLMREPFDVTLFMEDDEPDDGSVVITRDCVFPVCAPEIGKRMAEPADLGKELLLRDSAWSEDWANWLSDAVSPGMVPVDGPVHSLYAVALEEARRGAGVLMGHEILVEEALHRGDVVAPFTNVTMLDRWLVLRAAPAFARLEAFGELRSALMP